MILAAPAAATRTPPATAAMNNAMPKETVPASPRKKTLTGCWFCRMKMISNISASKATTTAAQTTPARVVLGFGAAEVPCGAPVGGEVVAEGGGPSGCGSGISGVAWFEVMMVIPLSTCCSGPAYQASPGRIQETLLAIEFVSGPRPARPGPGEFLDRLGSTARALKNSAALIPRR